MRVLIQRVSRASVAVSEEVVAAIQQGLLILVGVEERDARSDAEWLAVKLSKLRIFADEAGQMNRSIQEIDGELLVVSQFTLHASTKKGNRPSYIRAARPEHAIPLYEYFVEVLQKEAIRPVQTGRFGADMEVSLVNDGPVTIWIDSQQRE
jgi:D-tyrosyl-tRNA(Tyr) deacylase